MSFDKDKEFTPTNSITIYNTQRECDLNAIRVQPEKSSKDVEECYFERDFEDVSRSSTNSQPTVTYRTRFAPSPTGDLHLGHARTAMIAWLRARSQKGQFVLRMEDIDTQRCRPEFEQRIIEDLTWLGIDWDEGPDVGGARGPYKQTKRFQSYDDALEKLRQAKTTYPCTCTRKEIFEASSAPHETSRFYPQTCRHGASHPERNPSWRFRLSETLPNFEDALFGKQMGKNQTGDFVLKRADGLWGYHLACVLDDMAMGITEIVRGADLLDITPSQIALFEALDSKPPKFFHVPLVVDQEGNRLSKRHPKLTLRSLRKQGIEQKQILKWFAKTIGIPDTDFSMGQNLASLIHHFQIQKMKKELIMVNLQDGELKRMTP